MTNRRALRSASCALLRLLLKSSTLSSKSFSRILKHRGDLTLSYSILNGLFLALLEWFFHIKWYLRWSLFNNLWRYLRKRLSVSHLLSIAKHQRYLLFYFEYLIWNGVVFCETVSWVVTIWILLIYLESVRYLRSLLLLLNGEHSIRLLPCLPFSSALRLPRLLLRNQLFLCFGNFDQINLNLLIPSQLIAHW